MQKTKKEVSSNNYKIFETKQFSNDLNRVTIKEKEPIELKLKNYIYPLLRIEPHFKSNIRKLINWKPDTWRYRFSNYRIFYEINETEKIVYMITIKTRQNTY